MNYPKINEEQFTIIVDAIKQYGTYNRHSDRIYFTIRGSTVNVKRKSYMHFSYTQHMPNSFVLAIGPVYSIGFQYEKNAYLTPKALSQHEKYCKYLEHVKVTGEPMPKEHKKNFIVALHRLCDSADTGLTKAAITAG